MDMEIVLLLNFTNVTLNSLPGGNSCVTQGFSYHIHESWNHNDTYAHVGETDCGSDYTGNHWDPWLSSGTQVDCGSTDYNCNSTLFENDEYSCEIGDLSGKYGNTVLNVAGDGRYISTTNVSLSTDYEVSGWDLVNTSIVFHCGESGKRAICAPLLTHDSFSNSDCAFGQCCSNNRRDTNGCDYEGESNVALDGENETFFSWKHKRNSNGSNDFLNQVVSQASNNGSFQGSNFCESTTKHNWCHNIMSNTYFAVSMFSSLENRGPLALLRAELPDAAAALLIGNIDDDFNRNGDSTRDWKTYHAVSIQSKDNLMDTLKNEYMGDGVLLTEEAECGNILYRVYDSWNPSDASLIVSYNGTECDQIVGDYYDPINSCEEDSTMNTFCNCSDYKCDSNDYFNGKNRFECSPSDLSGKYGSIPYNGNNSVNSTFWDDLSISVDELDGKSLVLQCENTYEKIACAKFIVYNASDDTTTTVEPTDTGMIESTNESMDTDSAKKLKDVTKVGLFVLFNVLF